MTPEVKAKFTEKLKTDPTELAGRKVAKIVRTDGLKLIFDDGSWVCYRLSGTEPVVRAYTEARSKEDSARLTKAAEHWVTEEIKQWGWKALKTDSQNKFAAPVDSGRIRSWPGRAYLPAVGPSAWWRARWGCGAKLRRSFSCCYRVSLGLYAIFGHDGIVAYQQKQHQAQELHQQILSLQKENERLALHDQRLQSDRDTIEYEAREQMHYTRPGEVIYTLPEAPKAAQHK